jgi:hypothetical protein
MVSFASLQLPDGQVGSPYLYTPSILSAEAQSMSFVFSLVGLQALGLELIQKFDAMLIEICCVLGITLLLGRPF